LPHHNLSYSFYVKHICSFARHFFIPANSEMDFSILVGHTPSTCHIFFGISQRTYKSDSSCFLEEAVGFVFKQNQRLRCNFFCFSSVVCCEYFSFALFSSQYL
jgi:hypothetical protein